MVDKQKRYNKAYYRQNSEEISEKRKQKYESDPEVREKAVTKSREYREKVREERGGIDMRGRKQGPLDPREIELPSGKTVRAYSSGHIVEELGIAKSTLRKWIKEEKIPVTPYWLKSGRWWTQRMLNALVKAKDELNGGVKNVEFPKLVAKYWPKDEM